MDGHSKGFRSISEFCYEQRFNPDGVNAEKTECYHTCYCDGELHWGYDASICGRLRPVRPGDYAGGTFIEDVRFVPKPVTFLLLGLGGLAVSG